MVQSTATRWALHLVRLGLCAAAIAYLVFNVRWHDYVHLADRKAQPLRLIEDRGAQVVVLRDGQAVSLPRDQFARLPGGDELAIEFGLRSVAAGTRVDYALLALLLFLPVPILQSWRLVWMLAIQDVPLTAWNAIKLTFTGNFFNFALPGTTGGDLIKAYYITRFTHRKTEAVTTVFLDRVIGLIGLMLLASVMLLFSSGQIRWDSQVLRVMSVGLALVWAGLAVGSVVVFSGRIRRGMALPSFVARLPAGQHLLRVGRATVAMRHHLGLTALALASTVVLQLLVVVAAYVMSLALDMRGGAALYFIGVPIGFLIAAIPILPPQAFGVMEGAYILFFAQGGLNHPSQAVAFALANRLTQLVWSLPGVLVPLLGAHLPSKGELADLEAAAAQEARDPAGERTPDRGDEPAREPAVPG